MAANTIKVGFVGCGGITKLYTDIYANLTDIATVVAGADPVDELAERRRRALIEAYKAEAHLAGFRAEDARSDAKRESQLMKKDSSEAAAKTPIRKYRTYEDLLKDDEVQAIVVSTPPTVRVGPTVAAADSGRHVFIQGPMARSVEEADAMVAAVLKSGIKFISQCGSRYSRGMALAQKAVVRFDNGATGIIHASRITHDQEATPHGRIEVLGHDASLLVESREIQEGTSGRGRASGWRADTTFGSNDNPVAIEALEALRTEVSDIDETASEEYQSRLFLKSIISDINPRVPIEIPRHHVEVVRAIYKSAAEHQPVTLPLDKDDPFYGFKGRMLNN